MKSTTILLIHGFMGHPNEFVNIKKLFNNWGYEVFDFILTGHDGGKIKNVSFNDWICDSTNSMEKIIKAGYKKIILIGHSMGAILASISANNYKEYVSKIILINPAFEYLGTKNGTIKFFPSVNQAIKVYKDKQNNAHSSKIKRCTVNSVKNFCKLVKLYTKEIYNVKCPLMIIHGEKDYVVPIEKIMKIYNNINNLQKEFVIVKNGSHWVLSSPLDKEILIKIKNFIDK